MTEYVVLRTDHELSDRWIEVARIPARGARSAIKQHLETEDSGGEYVAVPARSWKPVTVKVETKTALRFS